MNLQKEWESASCYNSASSCWQTIEEGSVTEQRSVDVKQCLWKRLKIMIRVLYAYKVMMVAWHSIEKGCHDKKVDNMMQGSWFPLQGSMQAMDGLRSSLPSEEKAPWVSIAEFMCNIFFTNKHHITIAFPLPIITACIVGLGSHKSSFWFVTCTDALLSIYWYLDEATNLSWLSYELLMS